MATQLDIANRSLLSVGARAQISSFTPSDGSPEADAVSILWNPTFEALGRAAHWGCLTRQVTLSLLYAASGTPENPDGTTYSVPPTPWLYAYGYPSDALCMRFIVPSLPATDNDSIPPTTINNGAGTWIPSGGQIPFAISTMLDANSNSITVILTNQSQAEAVYTVNQPNPASWDSLFQAGMVASLAAFLVPALSLNISLMDRSIVNADRIIKQARAADGNEGVTTMDHLPDWMQARAGGQGYGTGWQATNYAGYNAMTWPGGGSYGY